MQTYVSAGDGSSYRIVTFNDLHSISEEKRCILDVRLTGEWEDAHIPDAYNIPLHELLDRMSEDPDDTEIWVLCASSYRASIAASLLDAHGRKPVLIDDNFQAARDIGQI